MKLNPANINILWASLIVEELVRHKVTFFCISPGSRSTPLTIAAAGHEQVETLIALDERGAAFYAIGYARATNQPAALICTSGTAVANYFPAVVEAYQSHLPLIILSADRPPELRDTGANQTIDQTGIYGSYTNWAIDLPAPDIAIKPQYVLSSIDQAFYQATRSPAGPVQINCMFREPLEPKPIPVPEEYPKDIRRWQKHKKPWTKYLQSLRTLTDDVLASVAEKLNGSPRTLLTVGRIGNSDGFTAIADLARATGWPVFADITSGFTKADQNVRCIGWYDQLLATESFKKSLDGFRILHFGDPLTSKRFLQFLSENPPEDYIHVHDHSRRQDPAHIITQRIETDISTFCAAIMPLLHKSVTAEDLEIMDKRTGELVGDFVERSTEISEIFVAAKVADIIPAGQGLYLGNSMPVRDFDMFGRIRNKRVRVTANRGASGIDGSIASAAGFAKGIHAPVTAVIGDLACLHDLNSLHLLSKTPHRIILIVINNNGGGIFSFLPISDFEKVFEPYFATPHDLRFGSVTEMFGLKYMLVDNKNTFLSVYQNALKRDDPMIIEVQTDREKNYTLHRTLLEKIIADTDQPGD